MAAPPGVQLSLLLMVIAVDSVSMMPMSPWTRTTPISFSWEAPETLASYKNQRMVRLHLPTLVRCFMPTLMLSS